MTIEVPKLPRRTLAAATQLYRIHAVVHGSWLFSGDELGRFNPVARVEYGACYWAEHPLGAWVESFRTRMVLSDAEVGLQVVSTIEIAEPLEVVDLANRRGLAAGVTGALTSGASYEESQDLASQLVGHVSGVRWRVRHDLAQELIGVALFGPRGPQPDSHFAPSTTQPIGRALIRAAEDAFGYRVVPVSAR